MFTEVKYGFCLISLWLIKFHKEKPDQKIQLIEAIAEVISLIIPVFQEVQLQVEQLLCSNFHPNLLLVKLQNI